MAQVQLLRPVLKRKFSETTASAAVPETIQPPKLQQQQAQQQSFAMVYTLLHSSLAQITYLRNLFPNGCFEDTSFDAIRTDAEEYYRHRTSHGSSMKKQRTHSDLVDPAAPFPTLKLLVQNPRNGILQGVLKQTTTAAQFCICADPTNRSNIIESYTFRFHYHGGRHLADLAVSGPSLYGFVVSAERCMSLADNSDWRPKMIEAGSMDSLHHRVSLNITHMQLAEEDEVDYDDLYGIPERMHHNKTVSRVLDTPNDRMKAHSNNSFPHLYEESEQSSNSDYAGNGSHLQIPQCPLDPMTMNPSTSRTLPDTVANTTIGLLSEDCSHVSQSVLDDVIATQRLPAPDPSQHYIKLSRETARRLEERGAPGWIASDGEDHVCCQCKFNEREGRMVHIQQSLQEGVCADNALPCRCSAGTVTTGSTIIATGTSLRCYQMTMRMRAIVVYLPKMT
ncbi:MAG: hypothetical protein Q9226_005136 [Calogaya cf. arnoldii]